MIDPAGLDAFRHVSIEELLVPLLIQLAIILLAARGCARIARRFGQPDVIGEIVAGLLLGPSFLQWLAPAAWEAVFRPTIAGVPHELSDPLLRQIPAVLGQIGLILLLFLVGLEFDFSHLRRHGTAAAGISLTGIALPFALGIGLGAAMHAQLEPHPVSVGPVPMTGFMLFLGVALSISA